VDCCRFINRLCCCFVAGVEYKTQDNNQAIKRSKILFKKILRAYELNQAHNQGGGNRAFASAPKFSGIILDFIKKVMLIFGINESPWTNFWLHVAYCKLSLLFLHVSAYSQQQLWIGCSLYSPRVKITYLDIESKVANHHFVNILAFESAIQVFNELASNVRKPTPAVKIIRLRCVAHETSFLNAINCDWFAWCGSLLWLNYYCWMMSASLNHCKKMGAEPGRRFLKQSAATLEPVNVVYVYW